MSDYFSYLDVIVGVASDLCVSNQEKYCNIETIDNKAPETFDDCEGVSYKATIIQLLHTKHIATHKNIEKYIYDFEERAAIIEFDGNTDRIDAERIAFKDIISQIESNTKQNIKF